MLQIRSHPWQGNQKLLAEVEMPTRREREIMERSIRRQILRSHTVNLGPRISLRFSGNAGENSRTSERTRSGAGEMLPRLRSEARASSSARGNRRRHMSLPAPVNRGIISRPDDYDPSGLAPLPRLRPRMRLVRTESYRSRDDRNCQRRTLRSISPSFQMASFYNDGNSSYSTRNGAVEWRAVGQVVSSRRIHDFFNDASDDEMFEGFGSEDEDIEEIDHFAEIIIILETGEFLRSEIPMLSGAECFSDDGEIPDDPFQREIKGSMPEPTMSLHAACVRGNTKELNRWKNWKTCRFFQKVHDDTPMHCAARAGDVGTVEELIQQGVSFTQRNVHRNTPLQIAARHGHTAVVKVLLQYGAGVDRDEMVHAYEATTCWSVVQTLRAHDPVDIKGISQASMETNAPWVKQLLFRVVQKGKVTMLKGLLSMGVNVDCRSILGWTPLQIATRRGHLKCVSALLEYGANVTVKDDFKWTALHYAAREGRHDIVKVLLKAGADVHAKCRTGRIPLQVTSDATTREVLKNYKKHQ